jgi:phenylacetic acid degradation protein PaaN
VCVGAVSRQAPAFHNATLPSWTRGTWWVADGDGVDVADAVTGEPVARVSSRGLDTSATVAHGREVGGPALRRFGFAERAGIVKQLALALKERRRELVDLSARTGATAADASVDVDGGIGTALVFAGLGAERLPDGNVLAEGDVEPLGRGGTFAGQHLLTPLRGVAVEVNAFNFPVWGVLEKLAPALIAGVPSIVKPATPTAYVTERAVRIMTETGLLPEGGCSARPCRRVRGCCRHSHPPLTDRRLPRPPREGLRAGTEMLHSSDETTEICRRVRRLDECRNAERRARADDDHR